jgi:hypothetical protein
VTFKTIRKIIPFILILMLPFLVSACGNNDKTAKNNATAPDKNTYIVGTTALLKISCSPPKTTLKNRADANWKLRCSMMLYHLT